ncbi:response regulator [Patescibacteria group bacterium]|nr:response regulator [Patescibacteria group bacterium]
MQDEKNKLLIVEDDEFLLNALERSFSEHGYDILKATDGEKGLSLALREHPDLILLDIVLPKMDGITMLKKLRKDSWGETAKVVMLSNLDRVDYQEASFENNASRYLVKTDWTLDQLTKKVLEVLSE